MADFLTRRFTNREKALMALLAVVLVVGVYFLLVHYPVQERIRTAEENAAELDLQIAVAEAKAQVYADMKAELDEIFAMPQSEITVMPAYDNIQNLMILFNGIFAGTEPTFSFAEVQHNGSIAARGVQFSFTAGSYPQARSVLAALTGTGNRCLLDSVSFAPVDGDVESGALRVSGNITFYELDETAAVPAP